MRNFVGSGVWNLFLAEHQRRRALQFEILRQDPARTLLKAIHRLFYISTAIITSSLTFTITPALQRSDSHDWEQRAAPGAKDWPKSPAHAFTNSTSVRGVPPRREGNKLKKEHHLANYLEFRKNKQKTKIKKTKKTNKALHKASYYRNKTKNKKQMQNGYGINP